MHNCVCVSAYFCVLWYRKIRLVCQQVLWPLGNFWEANYYTLGHVCGRIIRLVFHRPNKSDFIDEYIYEWCNSLQSLIIYLLISGLFFFGKEKIRLKGILRWVWVNPLTCWYPCTADEIRTLNMANLEYRKKVPVLAWHSLCLSGIW